MRTETQDGIEYRIIDFEGRIPGGEGIDFLYAEKTWTLEYRFSAAVRVVYADGGERQENALVLDISQGVFVYDLLWRFWQQPRRMDFIQRSAQRIIDFLDEAGMWEGELEGLNL